MYWNLSSQYVILHSVVSTVADCFAVFVARIEFCFAGVILMDAILTGAANVCSKVFIHGTKDYAIKTVNTLIC